MLRKKKEKKGKGQSTVEYVILVSVVVVAILAFKGGFTKAFQTAMKGGTNGMTDMANRLKTSRTNK